jgi:hypothetical protein
MMKARGTRRGIALVEAALSMVVISFLLVTALSGVAASRKGQRWNSDALRGQSLGLDLMSEILDKAYRDQNETYIWGPEPTETTGRPSWDDTDDYDGYSDSPPKDRAGAVIPGLTGWRRDVVVERLNPADIKQTSGSLTGVKRITVKVTYNGTAKAKLVAIRTLAVPR